MIFWPNRHKFSKIYSKNLAEILSRMMEVVIAAKVWPAAYF